MMRRPLKTAPLLLLVAGALGCSRDSTSGAQTALLDERVKKVDARLAAAAQDTTEDAPIAKWILPKELTEISGIAVMPDGRIAAHNDERGRVYVIDPKRGMIMKQFSLGESGVVADFEGIAVEGSDIFLMTSNGNVYQFREGAANANVPYVLHDTKLGKECEFEGIAIEPGTGAFLMPCKVIGKKSERNQLRIYRWLARRRGGPEVSTISVPLADAVGANGWKELAPSDITIDDVTGHYIIITGREKALIEITPQGTAVRSFPLPGSPRQPEGVAIANGVLIVSDEGVSRPADITLFPWRRASGTESAPAAGDSSTAN